MLPPRTAGDRINGEPTHIVTIVREPYSRMISLMKRTRSTLFDYTAHDDYDKVIAKWGDIYSKPFVSPLTVIGNLGILKFEMIEDAVLMMNEWLGLDSEPEFLHKLATKPGRHVDENFDEEKIKAMYDGKYAKHFGYEYSDNHIRT
jgi:hypothetical protein